MPSLTNVAAPLLALTHGALAWGNLGHETVGFIAQNYLSDDTVSWAQNILGDTSDDYLANVATWADSFRYTAAGKFSAPFHFIDANDKPPSSCSVDFDRDCGDEGCSVSAIANYTQIVQQADPSSEDATDALKFLVHFLGDITQPLHDEALEVGGNDIDVTFNGKKTNLHHIWDTEMPEKYVGGYQLDDAESWSKELIQAIDSGDYAGDKSKWISGMDVSDARGSALTWAADANTFVCSNTLKGGESAVEDKELSGAYYDNNIPIIKEQIAKGGYRLAAWLNLIATGKTGM